MASELIFRGQEAQAVDDDANSRKPHKLWLSLSVRYEQRLAFVLLGIVLASLLFTLLPSSSPLSASDPHAVPISYFERDSSPQRAASHGVPLHSVGRVPLGIKRKGLRIVVTGGAGFVGSHLVDRLIARGDSVIVVDNFFTGRKENVLHHFGNPRFELIRHDVVEPLLLEVDQIYHLACPASPVHYKFNPVKTIISSLFSSYIYIYIVMLCYV